MRAALLTMIAATLVAPAAHAAPAPLVGATEVARLEPDGAIADRAIADDGDGLLAYGWTDQATRAEVRVLDLATGKDVRAVDVSALSLRLERLWMLGTGEAATLFVVGRTEDGTQRVGALYDGAGKELRRFGPVDGIALHTRALASTRKAKAPRKPKKGARPEPITAAPGFESLVITYQVEPHKSGGDVHTVTAYEPLKGKRLGKPRALHLVEGHDKKLDFRFNHWADDWTVAVGVKGGTWDKKENQRKPDVEGRYDLLAGKFTSTAAITDLYEHAGRFTVLALFPNQATFVRMSDNLVELDVWRGEQRLAVTLDQPLDQYDRKSLSWSGGRGELLVGLKIDPWNASAVGLRREAPTYLDLYRLDGQGAGTRVARVLAGKKDFAFGVSGDKVWLVERNLGFDGGKNLVLYTIP